MVGIYTRKSKKDEGNDTSISIQKKEGIRFALSPEINEDYIIFDEGSGKSGRKIEKKGGKTIERIKYYRPQFARLIEHIKKGKVSKVYVLDQSRLERNVGLWELFCYEVIEMGCEYYPSGQRVDLSTAISKLQTNIISAVNQYYADYISERVTQAKIERVSKGFTVGWVAYGYYRNDEGKHSINKEEAKVVKRIFKESLAGNGAYSIAKGLNRDKIPTSLNKLKNGYRTKTDIYTGKDTIYSNEDRKWRSSTIQGILGNKKYKGVYTYGDVEVPLGVNIISEELFDEVQNNFENNKKRIGVKPKFNYLLNGLIYCACCGEEYRGVYRLAQRLNVYRCKNAHRPKEIRTCFESTSINIPKLDALILKILFERSDVAEFLKSIEPKSENLNELEEKLIDLRVEEKALGRYIEKGRKMLFESESDLSEDEGIKRDYFTYQKNLKRVNHEIESIITEIEENNHSNRLSRINMAIQGYNSNLDFETTKSLVHSIVKKIEKGTSVDANNLKLHIIIIHFKGFEETISLTTNRNCEKWLYLGQYKSKEAKTNEEIQEDLELAKFIDVDNKIDFTNFKGFDTYSVPHDTIIIKKEDTTDFNL